MIKPESIEQLKSAVDIADVIGNYVELRRTGASLTGRCPFHEERTGSFSVSPSRGFYHCFGCGASGDVIKFVQEIERIGFNEAAQKIADWYNIALEYESGEMPKRRDPRPLEALKRFFINELWQNGEILGYLQKRGVSRSSIERFEIGLALSGAAQIDMLSREKIPLPLAAEAGVVAVDEKGRHYARFTNRVMFPIYNPQGQIAGFGGRTIADHAAKYINSPQSGFFDKSRLLFALNFAKDAIAKQKRAIVCEGYMDAVMLHQAGFQNAVATLGTALTETHLPLLKKLGEPSITLSYDSDQAGQEAAFKAAKLLCARGFGGAVALIEGAKDPAELLEAGGSEKLTVCYQNAVSLARFVIARIARAAENKDAAFARMRQFLDTLAPFAREEAAAFAAAHLGCNPGRFRRSAFAPIAAAPFGAKSDRAELTLIKTLALNQALYENMVDYLNAALFAAHADLFAAIGDEKRLFALIGDENIKTLSPDEAKDAICKLLMFFYKKELKRLRVEGRIEAIKEVHRMIDRLKNGGLAPFKRF
ncbi:MAG: DNA primase [Helicobacteraceae bacterium]|jgi:DNA primase|nr:DNA primase [Helicobacteraceae bacterium]